MLIILLNSVHVILSIQKKLNSTLFIFFIITSCSIHIFCLRKSRVNTLAVILCFVASIFDFNYRI